MPETTSQSPFAERPVPALGNPAEVGPPSCSPPRDIDNDRALTGSDDPDQLRLWHLDAAGYATAFGDVPVL